MSQKENNNNQQNINNNIKSNIPEIKSLKNIDNNTLVYSNMSSSSKPINDNIMPNLLSQSNNNKEFKMDHSTNINSLENVKQDIINFYLIEQRKNEEKKREIELKRNLNNNMKKNKIINNKSKEKNRFEKYDKEKLSYEIYHQYQKLNFEKEKLPFLERMQLYALKKCLKDYKIEELTNIKSPKISEKQIIHTFNRLIEDSNRRNFQLYKKSANQNNQNISKKKNHINIKKNISKNGNNKNNENEKINNNKNKNSNLNNNNLNNNNLNKYNNNINNNQNKTILKKQNYKTNKSFDKQKWDEIYERRFSSKLKERNEKLEKMRQEKEEKLKKEEDIIIDNLNKKQNLINQKYGLKRSKSVNDIIKDKNNSYNTNNNYYIGNNKVIRNLNQRLYYNELNKKDIDYKTFMDKAQELINNTNNDYFFYLGKEEKKNIFNDERKKINNNKTNTFRIGSGGVKNKKMLKSNSVYNFRDYLDSNNENKKDEDIRYNNFIKLLNENKNLNNIENHENNEIKINKNN